MRGKKRDEAAPRAEEMALEGLAKRIGDDAVLRHHVLTSQTLFMWPSCKTVGIINLTSAALNSRLLRILAEIWLPQTSKPKTIPCEAARFEARWFKYFLKESFNRIHEIPFF